MASRGTSKQFEQKDIIIFSKFNGMNTQSDRHDLTEDKASWMENLQPIADNNLVNVPAPVSPIHTIGGVTITKQFYFNFGQNTDYIISFAADGSAYATVNPAGTTTTIATAGTFSSSPDVTQWELQRILIADSVAGYSTWDPTTGLVRQGGVSPNTVVTAGGSGYTSPTVTWTTSGSGVGATFTATQVGGVVTAVTLTNPGSGFAAGDTITLTIHDGGPGTGATATAHVWPFLSNNPTTLAVAFGRVWLGANNVLQWTGTGAGAAFGGVGYDDFASADASGSTTIADTDLIHTITALRNVNNYLYIVGDDSVKQIGSISVSSNVTNFTTTTLSSDQGTTFRDSVISFNRLLIFGNTVGVYAVFGASVEKISDDMDGIFRLIDFTQKPCSAVCDINNIHCLLHLVRYKDPVNGTRSLILCFMNKKWFVMSQGNGLKFIVTGRVNGVTETFGTSGTDIRRLLGDAATAVNIILSTSLTSHGSPFVGKKTYRYAVAQNITSTNNLNLLIESERMNQSIGYNATVGIQFVNNQGQNINFTGTGGAQINFFTTSQFFYQTGNTAGVSGIYIGATLSGPVTGFSLNSLMIEFGETAAFASTNVNINVL